MVYDGFFDILVRHLIESLGDPCIKSQVNEKKKKSDVLIRSVDNVLHLAKIMNTCENCYLNI